MSLPSAVVVPFAPATLLMRRVPVPVLRILLVLAVRHGLPAILLVVVAGFAGVRVPVRNIRAW